MNYKMTTAPAVEPVTGTELDTHLKGDGVLVATEEAFLDTLIESAREYIELETRRAMITQTWTLYMNDWPYVKGDDWWDGVREGSMLEEAGRFVELPASPLQSVESIKTYDGDNNSTTFAATNYFLDTTSVLGRIILNNGTVWPPVTRNMNGIEIIFKTGYGDAATDVPSALRQAVRQLAGHWYENREFVKTQSDQNQATTPMHIQAIINRYKVMKL